MAALVSPGDALGIPAEEIPAAKRDSGATDHTEERKTLMSLSQPAIVLVHGAWADASSWNSVLPELQQRGFTVYAPPNPLRGLPQDSASVHQFLTQNAALQGQPVVLVGHSYGGAVITNAAVGAPGVRALVYVDAFIPDEGDTIGGLASAEPGSCLGNEAFNPVPYPGAPSGDVDLYIKPDLVPDASPPACPPARPRSSRPPSGRSRPAPSPGRPGPRPGRPSRPGP
jgi:pimeloyl-ACP methyl ester carboxylesterase